MGHSCAGERERKEDDDDTGFRRLMMTQHGCNNTIINLSQTPGLKEGIHTHTHTHTHTHVRQLMKCPLALPEKILQ